MSPREALFMIPGFAHARVVGQIADGVTAVSWQVESGDHLYVLRIDKPEARMLGLDREGERDVQTVAARAGLTPKGLFHDIRRGISLRRWIDGRAWTAADLREPDSLDRLGRLLRDLHALPPTGPDYQPGVAARRYALQLDTAEAREIADEANLLLAELRFEPVRECLCHNDLVADNLIDSNGDGKRGLSVIDWEYAGIGDSMFDLAVLIQHHDLPPEARDRLLRAYFRRAATPAEALRLDSWCRFYRSLLRLWNMRVRVAPSASPVQ